jgi:hypothetical protein
MVVLLSLLLSQSFPTRINPTFWIFSELEIEKETWQGLLLSNETIVAYLNLYPVGDLQSLRIYRWHQFLL